MKRNTIRPARIKRIRKSCGLTQGELAALVGVSRSSVTSWELDRSKPLGPAVILLRQIESGEFPKIGVDTDGKKV